MNIIHLPSTFLPDSTGGKEVFVYNLIKNIPEARHEVVIHQHTGAKNYYYNDIKINALDLPKTTNARLSYFNLLYDSLSGFETLLEDRKPDIVHFHDQGEGASLSHVIACKARGIKTLLTYHSPG